MAPLTEQRVFYRLETALPVRYRVVCAGCDLLASQGSVINLSPGGMLLGSAEIERALLEKLLRREASIVIDLELGGGMPTIVVNGGLVWAEGPQRPGDQHRYGLHFHGLGERDQERVQEWIEGR